MFNPIGNKKGVTLIEAVIASFIMALGLFVVGTAVYSQFSSLNQNREKAIATLAAQGEIEFLRGQPFSNITTRRFYSDEAPALAYLHYGADEGKGEILVDSVAVTPDGFSGNSDIKKVSVIVSWDSIRGSTLSRKLVTFVTHSGIDKQ